MDEFGKGNLWARAGLERRSGIGRLGERFDGMAARVEELVRIERQLLEDVSKDLRPPLERLRLAAERVRAGEDGEATANRINREIERLATLVNTLIEVSRPEAVSTARSSGVVMLDEILRSVADDCTAEACAHQCGIALDIEAPATLRGHRELLRRAVENVVRNAVSHSPQLSMVEMRLRRREGVAEVLVRDFGPGVPAESLERMFDPSVRGEDGGGDAGRWAGYGLSIVRRAAALHRGEVRARNCYPGLAVTIELPLASV